MPTKPQSKAQHNTQTPKPLYKTKSKQNKTKQIKSQNINITIKQKFNQINLINHASENNIKPKPHIKQLPQTTKQTNKQPHKQQTKIHNQTTNTNQSWETNH